MKERVRARVSVRGRVQGVFFRAETMKKAISLGLDGWVRNVPDGSVEAVFEGKSLNVEQAIEWCRRGPRWSHVSNLDVTWEEPCGEKGFRMIL
jgi:acylphosphatase